MSAEIEAPATRGGSNRLARRENGSVRYSSGYGWLVGFGSAAGLFYSARVWNTWAEPGSLGGFDGRIAHTVVYGFAAGLFLLAAVRFPFSGVVVRPGSSEFVVRNLISRRLCWADVERFEIGRGWNSERAFVVLRSGKRVRIVGISSPVYREGQSSLRRKPVAELNRLLEEQRQHAQASRSD